MSQTTDYAIDNGIDLTDPREPKILLDEDDGYQEWSDLLDEERFEEIMNETGSN